MDSTKREKGQDLFVYACEGARKHVESLREAWGFLLDSADGSAYTTTIRKAKRGILPMIRIHSGKLRAALFCAALILTCSRNAGAQARIVGNVSVSVKDPAGAVIPGAKVTLKDEGTGIAKQDTTNEQGGILFPDLSHGLFEVTVSAAGFQTAVVSHINVETSRTTDVLVAMKVGAQEQSITVEASAEVLETSSNLVSSVVSREDIAELPFIGRSTLGLARLTPGMVQNTNSPVGSGDSPSSNRSRPPQTSMRRSPARCWKSTANSRANLRWSIPTPPARPGSSS